MFPQKSPKAAFLEPQTYTLVEPGSQGDLAMGLVSLSHTSAEHRLYRAMLEAVGGNGGRQGVFQVRRLMEATAIRSSSTLRRALEGLRAKLCIEQESHAGQGRSTYRVFTPTEVMARRASQDGSAPRLPFAAVNGSGAERAFQRVCERGTLSRREAQVALCCAEGLSNAQIGERLSVTEETVKFHLRSVFLKFGVRRRAELIARLLM